MGASLSSPLMLDPFDDPGEVSRRRLMALKGTSPVTSSSSLASTSASIIEATGNIIMGTNAPQLYEHALIGDWEALLRRIITHPKEACYKDKCENTALHISCRRQPPPAVVKALINANPEALTSYTVDGLTPLHFSCFCGSSPETILLTVGNETSLREMVDRRGRTPLHCVCAGFRSPHRLSVVKMLLQVDPSAATAVDERGRTPLSLIVDDYVEELHEALATDVSTEDAIEATLEGGNLCDCWSVVTLLLRAAYAGTLEDNSAGSNEFHVGGKFRILHAAVGIGGCPAAIILLILKVNPSSIEEKDGDLNLPLHVACKTVGQAWSRKVVVSSKKSGGVVVYNADFGQTHPKDDVTSELIAAYTGAAKIPDDSGKFPLILAVESGKPWTTSLQPLWEAYHLGEDDFPLLEKALQGALMSMSPTLRSETIKSMKDIIPLWPTKQVDDMLMSMIAFACDTCIADDNVGHEWKFMIEGSTLQGVAATLEHIGTSAEHLKDSPQQALELALPLLSSRHELVRVAAAKVLGYAVARMALVTTELALKDVIFLEVSEQDDASVSTMGLSCANSADLSVNSESDCSLHGRAMACYFLLDAAESPILLTEQQRGVLKQWTKHEAAIVRKGACWAVGVTLRVAKDLKEFRSPLLKLMRATENVTVHVALSQSLVQASTKHDRLFLCKSGLPILDGALMLSMSRGTSDLVQQAFHSFLWHALQKQESGLQEYMDMAEGENGRIMMSLVTKRLSRLPAVAEEDEESKHEAEQML